MISRRAVAILLLSVLMILPMASTALATCDVSDSWCRAQTTTPAKVIINGIQIHASPGPIIENDRVLVPLRAFAEALGVTIEWDDRTKTVRAYMGQGLNYTTVTVGSSTASHNGTVYAGERGGHQYHIPGFEYVLEAVGNPTTLFNWMVSLEAFSKLRR